MLLIIFQVEHHVVSKLYSFSLSTMWLSQYLFDTLFLLFSFLSCWRLSLMAVSFSGAFIAEKAYSRHFSKYVVWYLKQDTPRSDCRLKSFLRPKNRYFWLFQILFCFVSLVNLAFFINFLEIFSQKSRNLTSLSYSLT